MDSYLQGNSDQLELSPWNPHIEEQQLYSKIISYNVKNDFHHRDLKKLRLDKLYNNFSELSKKPQKDFRRESNSFENLITLRKMEQNRATFLQKKNNPLCYQTNKTEPIEQKLNQQSNEKNEVNQKDIFGLHSFRRYKNRKENIELFKVQQQLSANLRMLLRKKKTQSNTQNLKINEHQTFLKKNLINRQSSKVKITRPSNLVLPKIEICNVVNRLV